MKLKLLCLLFYLTSFGSFSQALESHILSKDRLTIKIPLGDLNIIPLSDDAIRIQLENGTVHETRELILINQLPTPAFKFTETSSSLELRTKMISVSFDKKTGSLTFADLAGNVFLSEIPGSRKLTQSTVKGEPCFVAEQKFTSPEDEYLFGLGQFQDGQYNLRNVSRKLTQVNSQISIPFVYSSKGYGILWHQYGLTDFNPSDNFVSLTKIDTASGTNRVAEVTTTAGTQRISQQQSLYNGKLTVEKTGQYSVMLDMGDMESRHLLIVDGKPVIDQSNLWLPPTVGKLINLEAGEHTVQVVCKTTNTPKLSWKLATNETTYRSPEARSLDYVVFYGKDADEVIAQYRDLSGNVPMLPLWAYGFWQCRERYHSGTELVDAVKEFRKRNLPMDVIVQDWQYWGKNGWGVPKFDETNYPNPDQFIKELHDLHAHFSVSVWENLDQKSDVAKPYIENNLFIPNTPWIDIFNPLARETHWNALNTGLFSKGVDSWWMDATEPENDALAGVQTYFGLGNFYRLTYPLFVSQAIYEGQRHTNPDKRVAILTRSAFAGQQRYGTINWSGDIAGTWDSYRRQMVAGLNYSLTGMPYWTTDIGGFFRPGRGQYTDDAYRELLTRWFQWGTFNTIFRIHGYQSETEPWKYGDTAEENMRSMLNLRYRLMPYIYSEGWQVSKNGSTMMRPLVMDFRMDSKAVQQSYEYMFGKAFLIAPVTEPGLTQEEVYLPKGSDWYDFWTGKRTKGGQSVTAAAPLDKIPVFVKAGSIVPMGKFIEYTSEKPMDTLEIRVFTGADAGFVLYADEGDTYHYENGQYRTIPFHWDEQKQTLTIDKWQGNFPGALQKHIFNITWVNESNGYGIPFSHAEKVVAYTGKKITIKRN